MYKLGLKSYEEAETEQARVTVRDIVCEVCSRKFRRESDKKMHKCVRERQKPVSKQRGAAQCQKCLRWFKSKGGLAVQRCRPGG